MNIGQMLAGLGCRMLPKHVGLPCPAVINSQEFDPIGGTSTIETRAEVEAYCDARKTVAERATTKRSPGNWF